MIESAYSDDLARRLDEAEETLAFVRLKIAEYVASDFDPSLMGSTLDEIRHRIDPAGELVRRIADDGTNQQ